MSAVVTSLTFSVLGVYVNEANELSGRHWGTIHKRREEWRTKVRKAAREARDREGFPRAKPGERRRVMITFYRLGEPDPDASLVKPYLDALKPYVLRRLGKRQVRIYEVAGSGGSTPPGLIWDDDGTHLALERPEAVRVHKRVEQRTEITVELLEER